MVLSRHMLRSNRFCNITISRLPLRYRYASTCSKLRLLREQLSTNGIDAYIIPSGDPHMSEYTASCFDRRQYMTNFTGSAGTAIVTTSAAFLWTDGRYYGQAEQELDSNEWTLMKSGEPGVPDYITFLKTSLPRNSAVGYDPLLHSSKFISTARVDLSSHNIHLKALSDNLVDKVWGNDRPSPPASPIRVHDIAFAGLSTRDKLHKIREYIVDKCGEKGALIVTLLDEIAWVLNIRGADIPCNPVAVAYVTITLSEVVFHIDDRKVNPEVCHYLADNDISVQPYDAFIGDLKRRVDESDDIRFVVDEDGTTDAVSSLIPHEKRILAQSPIALMKAIKNRREINAMKACHVRDGAACVHFLAVLQELLEKQEKITEYDIDIILTSIRKSYSKEKFIGPSFPTIAGFGPNGAIIHYRALKETCSVIGNGILLLDSGGQYVDGTTDVTRTICTGEPSVQQKAMYTRVLMGHIDLARCVFPKGTPGCMLDSLARTHLWRAASNYSHGTGHGVGAALNVHEGPQRISSMVGTPQAVQALLPGMIVSIEPGYYESGNYGIRLENLYSVVDAAEKHFEDKVSESNGFLAFEPLTCVPFQRDMIVTEMLDDAHIAWINKYHEGVFAKLSPVLNTNHADLLLGRLCSPLL
mmetsp:Transcript_10818/g.16466  ORF Transcript_10818/g.16466 Transcript_10818/m.16466 type:complete len:641 (-) Transcript_10818:45-1967(-)